MFKNLRSMTRYIERSLVSGLCLCLVTHLCLTLWDPLDWSLLGSCVRGDSAGKNTGVGSHALLQGIFPTQGLNSGLPNFRQIIYHLSHPSWQWGLIPAGTEVKAPQAVQAWFTVLLVGFSPCSRKTACKKTDEGPVQAPSTRSLRAL